MWKPQSSLFSELPQSCLSKFRRLLGFQMFRLGFQTIHTWFREHATSRYLKEKIFFQNAKRVCLVKPDLTGPKTPSTNSLKVDGLSQSVENAHADSRPDWGAVTQFISRHPRVELKAQLISVRKLCICFPEFLSFSISKLVVPNAFLAPKFDEYCLHCRLEMFPFSKLEIALVPHHLSWNVNQNSYERVSICVFGHTGNVMRSWFAKNTPAIPALVPCRR